MQVNIYFPRLLCEYSIVLDLSYNGAITEFTKSLFFPSDSFGYLVVFFFHEVVISY